MGMLQGANGENSSKRIIGFIGILWTLFSSTAYGVCIQMDGKESESTEGLLMTAFITFSAMITGGVIEGFSKKK